MSQDKQDKENQGLNEIIDFFDNHVDLTKPIVFPKEYWQTLKAHCTQPTGVQQLKVSTMRILEEIQDRACKVGLPIGLSDFTNYLRSLYPEYYSATVVQHFGESI